MIHTRILFLPQEHAERVILTDDFGHQHELKIHLVRTREDGRGGVVHESIDPQPSIEAAINMMAGREEAFRQAAALRGHTPPKPCSKCPEGPKKEQP